MHLVINGACKDLVLSGIDLDQFSMEFEALLAPFLLDKASW